MICPYCRSDLEIKDTIEQENAELISGSVKCDCNEYPILEGILNLKESNLKSRIIGLIKQRRFEEATICSLWNDGFETLNSFHLPMRASKLTWALEQALMSLGKVYLKHKYRPLYNLYIDKKISFHNLLGKSLFETYFKQRFSSESFWSLYPFIPLLTKNKEKILDLGCGVGHASFVLDKYVEPKQLFSADYSFRNLFLAKKYFTRKAEFICLDANNTLPFKTGTFSSILMLDTFHYVHFRASLAHEMERTISSTGLLLLLHVHNYLAYNLGAGKPLTPKSLSRLFSDGHLETKVMPEKKIVEDFLFHNKLNLANQYDEDELNSSNATILVATSNKSIYSNYDEVDYDFLRVKNNLIINPIYEIERKEDIVFLKRSTSELFLGDILPFSEEYLPKKLHIKSKSLGGRQIQLLNSETLTNLRKQFVIINVPENYI